MGLGAVSVATNPLLLNAVKAILDKVTGQPVVQIKPTEDNGLAVVAGGEKKVDCTSEGVCEWKPSGAQPDNDVYPPEKAGVAQAQETSPISRL